MPDADGYVGMYKTANWFMRRRKAKQLLHATSKRIIVSQDISKY